MTLSKLSAAAFCLALCVALPGYAAGRPAGRPIVVLITIDGLPARALRQSLPMPTLLSLAATGALADGMVPINPTVTWPNHTTLVTGVDASRHHVIANGLLQVLPGTPQVEVNPDADKKVLVHANTLYDIAAEHGLSVGQVDWVAVAGADNIAWQFEEKPSLSSPIVQEMIRAKRLTAEDVAQFGEKSPSWRDEMRTDAAIDILTHHTPDLLLLHLLQTDTLQHRYGPLTPAAYAAYANADNCLARIVAAAKEAGLSDRVTYIVVSDHGFSTVHHLIRLGAFIKQQTEMDNVAVKAEGGDADIFVRGEDREQKRAQLTASLRTLQGVAHVYSNAEAQHLGMPATGSTSQAPDLWLTASSDYAFEDGEKGPVEHDVAIAGQHGYLNSDPEMYAVFVASGAGIKPGTHLRLFPNLQVAPTIAHILGLPLPDAQAEPLWPILR